MDGEVQERVISHEGRPGRRPGRIARAVLCLALLLALIPASGADRRGRAEDAGKTVRVGWFESSFNTLDAAGRRSGYAYEYQQKVAAYTGWRYEYVSGSWPELMEKLKNGEIDLMSDVSHTKEREAWMLFPSLPMGTEEYYLFIAPESGGSPSGTGRIQPENEKSLEGKTVGVNRGSVQAELFRTWLEKHGVRVRLVEVTGAEAESLAMLETGELDAYVTVDSFTRPERTLPVWKIGSSDFFFAVNRNRPDLLEDLNGAMSRIQAENRYFNQQMFERFVNPRGANAFLAPEEKEWIDRHQGTIRVGYQDNYMAFCAQDKATGGLTGALKDYLAYAADCLVGEHLDFQPTPFGTISEAMAALERGEIDCVFPANLTTHDGEKIGAVLTPPVTRTDMYAIVRAADQSLAARGGHVNVAVNEGNTNYDVFLDQHYPEWTRLYFENTDACLDAVSRGVADCVLISYYRYNNIARQCDRLRLKPVTTGIAMDYCFAVRAGNTALYAILSRVTGLVPEPTLNVAMSNYMTEDARLTLGDYVSDHLPVVIGAVAAVIGVILTLLILSMKSERKARRLIAATETDELTGLYNRGYFLQYAGALWRSHPETPMDAIVVNIDRFHAVNAIRGRDFGDQALRTLGEGIRETAARYGGIAGRFGADRFDIYCRHTEDYQGIFDSLQRRVEDFSPTAGIRLRMGVMPFKAGMDPVGMFDRARTACSMSRGRYQGRLIIYDEAVGQREGYEQRLLNDLPRALNEYEFEVYYQPKFDIRENPPKLVSAEALVRWNHPELGLVSPGDFIPLFERNGQIAEIDKYVWSHAARKIMRWREEYGVSLSVSVNLSRVDIFDPALEKTLDDLLAYYGLSHGDLKLEVTESAYTENARQLIQVVGSLRGKGYQVEMDDFGTGYSSLNMLSEMPVDILKMDQAFVRRIGESEKADGMVALIMNIARTMKIPVIAEGVETEEQLTFLKRLGCPMVQGFYFSRPLHASEFERKYIRGRKGA
ncbi:MAG: EAL domain-containing protein [Clostridia bacterium]|nr:EAL domain-containing protein [Clostridia bacterium]